MSTRMQQLQQESMVPDVLATVLLLAVACRSVSSGELADAVEQITIAGTYDMSHVLICKMKQSTILF